MFVSVIFLLFGSAINFATSTTDPYYWRIYDDSFPDDAVLIEDKNVFVARVGVCDDNGVIEYYPATGNIINKTATAAMVGKKRVVSDRSSIMVLCSSEPKRLQWKYVNIESLEGKFLNNLVRAGYHEGYRYVGKVFHDNQWKIGAVYQHGHKWAGLKIWNKNGNVLAINDFQILTVNKLSNENIWGFPVVVK